MKRILLKAKSIILFSLACLCLMSCTKNETATEKENNTESEQFIVQQNLQEEIEVNMPDEQKEINHQEVSINFSPSKKVSNTFFELCLDESMDVEEANSLIFKDIENQNEVIFYNSYRVSYADKKIVMYAIVKLNDEQNDIINSYMKNNKINVDYISLDNHWSAPLDFYNNDKITITEYIRNLANEWCTDDFGFFIDEKNKGKTISYMNIYFENIYSTYIEKGGSTTSWKKENVKEFEDQENPGIKFYYLMEESMKTIELKEPEDIVSVIETITLKNQF